MKHPNALVLGCVNQYSRGFIALCLLTVGLLCQYSEAAGIQEYLNGNRSNLPYPFQDENGQAVFHGLRS
jgi:hypothetical protein